MLNFLLNTLRQYIFIISAATILLIVPYSKSFSEENIFVVDKVKVEGKVVNRSIETINSELKEIKQQLIKDKEQLKNALLSSEEDLKKHNLDRKTLIDKIDVKLLAKYNELSDRGSAVVTLNSNCCGNCFSVLPPQKIVEIKSNDLINLCTSCGVYVFFEE